MAGPTHRSTWKARERKAAAIFGAKRQRCSGSSGRSDCSRSDSTHENLFIETKLAAVNATITLFDETRKLAVKEKKIPVLCLSKKGRRGLLIAVAQEDIPAVIAEYIAGLPPKERSSAIRLIKDACNRSD